MVKIQAPPPGTVIRCRTRKETYALLTYLEKQGYINALRLVKAYRRFGEETCFCLNDSNGCRFVTFADTSCYKGVGKPVIDFTELAAGCHNNKREDGHRGASGHWEKIPEHEAGYWFPSSRAYYIRCSECGFSWGEARHAPFFRYCPRCGAKMTSPKS